MARRRATKASGKTVSAAARALRAKAKDGPAVGTLAERLAVVERERDALKEELEQLQVARAPAGGNPRHRCATASPGPSIRCTIILEGKG